MKRNHLSNFAILLGLSGLLFGSCQSDNSDQVQLQNQILGKWQIHEAYRNGKIAESLDDLYFEFFEDGKIRTNLLGANAQFEYTLEDQLIKQKADDNGIEVDYAITEVSDTALVLTTLLRRYNFKFDLRKSIEVE